MHTNEVLYLTSTIRGNDWANYLNRVQLPSKETNRTYRITSLAAHLNTDRRLNWGRKEVLGSDSEINFPKFKSNLGDFPNTAVSVFERSNVITHWKPVVLLAKSK